MTHEQTLEYLRNAPEPERWCWLADELREGNSRMDGIEKHGKPCRAWHGAVIKWLVGLVLTVGSSSIVYLAYLVGVHVFGKG
jgi:hypothetical protein